jgi:hypothetical protein
MISIPMEGWSDFFFCLVAFFFHEVGHIWMAKSRGVYLKTTAWKLFGFIPIGALVWIDKNKATIQDQLDVSSAGIWVGLPFTLLMFNPKLFFSVYMIACCVDVFAIVLLSIFIILGLPRFMTINEAGRRYDFSISWRGIKLKDKSQTTGVVKRGSSIPAPATKVGEKHGRKDKNNM